MVTHKLVMHFPAAIVEQPLIYRLVKEHNLIINILKADISPQNEGSLIMEIRGRREQLQGGIRFLEELGVQVEPHNKTIIRNEAKCTQCGACLAVCPVGALYLEPPHMNARFALEKCVICGSCAQYCPFKAIEVDWGQPS